MCSYFSYIYPCVIIQIKGLDTLKYTNSFFALSPACQPQFATSGLEKWTAPLHASYIQQSVRNSEKQISIHNTSQVPQNKRWMNGHIIFFYTRMYGAEIGMRMPFAKFIGLSKFLFERISLIRWLDDKRHHHNTHGASQQCQTTTLSQPTPLISTLMNYTGEQHLLLPSSHYQRALKALSVECPKACCDLANFTRETWHEWQDLAL